MYFKNCIQCLISLNKISSSFSIFFFLRTHHIIVTNCFLGGPRNSSFVLRSKIQTTAPTRRKDIPVTHHINGVNGLKNAQALEFNFQTGATTTSPDSIYGCVKSTIFILFVVIVMSPTTASKSYTYVTSKLVNQEL